MSEYVSTFDQAVAEVQKSISASRTHRSNVSRWNAHFSNWMQKITNIGNKNNQLLNTIDMEIGFPKYDESSSRITVNILSLSKKSNLPSLLLTLNNSGYIVCSCPSIKEYKEKTINIEGSSIDTELEEVMANHIVYIGAQIYKIASN